MNGFLPSIIVDGYKKNEFSGELEGTTLFLDISGFTIMGNMLSSKGNIGIETLSDVIRSIFDPLIKKVYNYGGFITGFSGDAFTAIFPDKNHLKSIQAAMEILEYFKEKNTYKTDLGDFTLGIKIGMSFGRIKWGITGSEKLKTYYFKGLAIDNCVKAAHLCDGNDIVIDGYIKDLFSSEIEIKEIKKDFYRIIKFSGSIIKTDFSNCEIDLPIEILEKFIPRRILEYGNKQGSFRNIVSLFLKFKNLDIDESDFNDFTDFLLKEIDILEGYVKYIDYGDKGSNMLIVFGAPIAHENDAERAAELSLKLIEKYKRKIKIGIASGNVFAGIIGNSLRCSYDVIGEAVNLSARLMQLDEMDDEDVSWGKIIITDRLGRLLDKKYKVSRSVNVYLKGIIISEACELKSRKNSEIRSLHRKKFVGRTKELSIIEEFGNKLWRGDFAGIIFIYGEAGAGKSRIVDEYLNNIKSKVEICTLQGNEINKIENFSTISSFFFLNILNKIQS